MGLIINIQKNGVNRVKRHLAYTERNRGRKTQRERLVLAHQ